MKKTSKLWLAILAVLIGLGMINCDPNTQTGPTVINIAAIQGVTAPVAGQTPVTSITENAQYSGTVQWDCYEPTFGALTEYTATIYLTAKTGYTLQGVSANFFTVAEAETISNSASSGVITAAFPATGDATTAISIAAIQGVTRPVTGQIPVTTITENEQFTGTVQWSDDPVTFAAETTYTATITLTPEEGYTLQGVTADFFTVTGATTVTNDANSGIITAVFPATIVPIFYSIPSLAAYLESLPDNTAATPYNIALNVDSLPEGSYDEPKSDLQNALSHWNKYVSLDLSGSTFASIGEYAFFPCDSLTSITLPEGVTSIGEYAFGACSRLTSITLPEGVTSIDIGAFFGCRSLTSITLPEGVTSIGYVTFWECTSLTSITIPASVTSIDLEAFKDCTSLTSVTIPDSVTSIGIPISEDALRAEEEWPTLWAHGYFGVFSGCTSLASITIPGNATIGDYAFSGCTRLGFVSIGNNTSIGDYAFSGCTNLTSVAFRGNNNVFSASSFPGNLYAQHSSNFPNGNGYYSRSSDPGNVNFNFWTKTMDYF